MAVIKGVEYGCLRMAVAWLGSRPWGGLAAHAGLGLLVGTVFGGALVLFSAGALGKRISPHPDRGNQNPPSRRPMNGI